MTMSTKERIRFWFDDLTTPMGRATDLVVLGVIVVACVSAVADTYALPDPWPQFLTQLDHVITIVFIVEYLLRLWVAEHRIRHIFEIYSLIDLLAILPSLPIFGPGSHFAILRTFRLVRLIRFLETREFFFGTIKAVHLYVARVVFTLVAIPFVSAGLIFYAEQGGGQFNSFFDAFYYSVVALTTVGFGDLVPVTTAGRAITILMIGAGIVFIPWQVKNLVAQFMMSREKAAQRCATCGLEYHDRDARFCKKCGAPIEIAEERQ
jgi:voltage-gated potassium channel